MNVQYLQDVDCSIRKVLNVWNHSLSVSHQPIKNSLQQNFLFLYLMLFAKPSIMTYISSRIPYEGISWNETFQLTVMIGEFVCLLVLILELYI